MSLGAGRPSVGRGEGRGDTPVPGWPGRETDVALSLKRASWGGGRG